MPNRIKDIRGRLTVGLVKEASKKAFKSHKKDLDVIRFKSDFDANICILYFDLLSGDISKYIKYRQMSITSTSGKERKIDAPYLELRILQHTVMLLLSDIYKKKDTGAGKNCKEGYGVSSKNKKKSIIYPMKQVFFDRRDLNYWLLMDQRKCYEHIKPSVFRKAVKRLTTDKWLINVILKLAFTKDGRFPVGTPLSPFAHHIIMLDFDKWMETVSPVHIRYADDNFSAYPTKEEMNRAKWRIANFWWYNYQIRVKRSIKASPFGFECDLCGYRFFRTDGKSKGYVKVRGSLVRRIFNKRRKELVKGWPSYYGILKHADAYHLTKKIIDKMKLKDLTTKIRIDRHMDARNIDMRDLVGLQLTIYDYDIKQSPAKEDNWIKMLVGIPEHKNGEPTGRMLAREVHGSYQYIIQFLRLCEKYGNFLPLEDVEIENQCGYIFKDSTNQMTYI